MMRCQNATQAASPQLLSLRETGRRVNARLNFVEFCQQDGAARPENIPSVSIIPFQIEDRRQQCGDLRKERLIQRFLVPLYVALDGFWTGRAE